MSDENKNLNFGKKGNKIESEAGAVSGEDLGNVAGGAVFYAGRWAGDKDHPWEVINDETGRVESRWATKKDAYAAANKEGQSTERYYLMSSIKKKRDSYNNELKRRRMENMLKHPQGIPAPIPLFKLLEKREKTVTIKNLKSTDSTNI